VPSSKADAPQGALCDQARLLWGNIVHLAKTQEVVSCWTRCQKAFKVHRGRVLPEQLPGLVFGDHLASDKLGRKYVERNAKLCSIIGAGARHVAVFHRHRHVGDAYEYLIGSSRRARARRAASLHAAADLQHPFGNRYARSQERPLACARSWRVCSISPAGRVRCC